MSGLVRKFAAARALALAVLRSIRAFRWAALLHPRHTRASAATKDDTVRWEDLLRPRKPDGR